MDKGKQVVATFNAMKGDRQLLDKMYWKPAFELTLPHRGLGFITGDYNSGYNQTIAKNYQARIYDTTAIDSIRLLASSIISGLTPASSQWFNLQVPNISTEELETDSRMWLDKAARQLFKHIHTSNYNSTAFEFFQDVAIGGMAGLYIEKDAAGFKFETWQLHGMYCADKRGDGVIDTVYRIVPMTPSQMVHKFGEKKVPEYVRKMYKDDPCALKTIDVIHGIYPNMKGGEQYNKGKFADNMPWQSCYVDLKTSQVLKESGFHEMPVIVPRWSLLPGSEYAVGPLNDALPDVKTLNKVQEMMLTNAEMSIAGAFVIEQTSMINPNTARIKPRALIPASSTDAIKPLTAGGDFRISFEIIERLSMQVRSMLMSDELSPIDKANPTATEVQVRSQIIRQVLGPTYARLQSEFLEPLINRCFNLALRDGTLGEMPVQLQQQAFLPEYTSPLARAQKAEDIQNMDRYEEAIVAGAQVKPEMLDIYNWEKAARKRAELEGVPQDLIRSKDEVEAIRIEQQKQAQAMQQQQAMQQMAMQGGPPQ